MNPLAPYALLEGLCAVAVVMPRRYEFKLHLKNGSYVVFAEIPKGPYESLTSFFKLHFGAPLWLGGLTCS